MISWESVVTYRYVFSSRLLVFNAERNRRALLL